MTTLLNSLVLPTSVEESSAYSFNLPSALPNGANIRWTIILNGIRPASSDDFSALKGSFTASQNRATINLFNNDNVPEVAKTFQINVYQVVGSPDDGNGVTEQNDVLLGQQTVRLTDQDSGDFLDTVPINSGFSDFVSFGHSADIDADALGGADFYVVTRHHESDAKIDDLQGVSTIKFDRDVVITGLSEVLVASRGQGFTVSEITLQFEGGGSLNVNGPTGNVAYQLGDGTSLNYTAFKSALGATGDGTSINLAEDVWITTDIRLDDYTRGADNNLTHILENTGFGDAYYLGSSVSLNMDGLGGQDTYVIGRYQYGDALINDTNGVSTVKIDHDVSITDVEETTRPGRVTGTFVITGIILTLSTGADITIAFPTVDIDFQIGDGERLTYDQFKAAIGAIGSGAQLTFSGPHVVSRVDADPVVTVQSGQVIVSPVGNSETYNINIVRGQTYTDGLDVATFRINDPDTIYSAGDFTSGASSFTIQPVEGERNTFTLHLTAGNRLLSPSTIVLTVESDGVDGVDRVFNFRTAGDSGAATFHISTSETGNEHVTSFNLNNGDILYAVMTTDDDDGTTLARFSYEWFRSTDENDEEGISLGLSGRGGSLDLLDEYRGNYLWAKVTYIDDEGTVHTVTTTDRTLWIRNHVDKLGFIIMRNRGGDQTQIDLADASTDLRIGDTLTIVPDPNTGDGNGNTQALANNDVTYEWFIVGGDGHADGSPDIGASYTITQDDVDTGRKIAVRYKFKDDDGFTETGMITLFVPQEALPEVVPVDAYFDRSQYDILQARLPAENNSVTSGTTQGRNEIILGQQGDDTLNGSHKDNVLAGGTGSDTINLGDGAETVVYRFSSADTRWVGTDGRDIINNFDRLNDKFLLVDIDTDSRVTSLNGVRTENIEVRPIFLKEGTKVYVSGVELIFADDVRVTINYVFTSTSQLVRIDTTPFNNSGDFSSAPSVGDLFGTASGGQKPEHLMTTATSADNLADDGIAEGNRLTHIPNLFNFFETRNRLEAMGDGLNFLEENQPLGFDIL